MTDDLPGGNQAAAPPPPIDAGHDLSRGPPLDRRATVALLALALLADICLYKSWGGSGGAVLLILTLLALPFVKGGRVANRPLATGGLAMALAAVLVWSAWWLAIVTALAALFVYAVKLWRPEWSLLESLWAGAGSALRAPARLVGHVARFRAAPRVAASPSVPARVILIPVAVSVVFVLVFAAANPVVASQLGRLWRHVADVLVHFTEYLSWGRIFFWLLWLLVFAALIRPVVHSRTVALILKADQPMAPGDPSPRDPANFQVALLTLVCVNALFLAYNALDAVYLYFKATLPDGITWSAYTHAGCGWLTFGLFLSTLVLGVIFWQTLNFHPRSGLLKRWAYGWIALNAVLAVGTLRRIHMYIDYSGLTHLLLTGVYGALLVMAGLAIMAVKVHRNHNTVWLMRRYVAAFATGIAALALTPHGYLCARYNVPRILADKPQAMWPVVLKRLPADALPPVIALLDYRRADGDLHKEKLVREGIAAILGQHLERLERDQARPWSQWQASSHWALKHLRAARDRIHATLPPEQWPEARKRLSTDYDLMSGAPRTRGIRR